MLQKLRDAKFICEILPRKMILKLFREKKLNKGEEWKNNWKSRFYFIFIILNNIIEYLRIFFIILNGKTIKKNELNLFFISIKLFKKN